MKIEVGKEYRAEVQGQSIAVRVLKIGWFTATVLYGVNMRDDNGNIEYTQERISRIPKWRVYEVWEDV